MTRLLSSPRAALIIAVTLAGLVSLPQVLPLHAVVDHQDPLFSLWRIAWIGHALATSPTELFHGNIFYPHRYTLTYSDAVLVQGLLGTALHAVGLAPAVAYNLLIWASFPLSALFMFLLAHKVSGHPWAAAVAALAYALGAYRFDHIMHLEQVWTQWLPLHFLLTLEALERGTWRAALALAASLLLQLFSGLYLFLFTVTTLPVFVVGHLAATRSIPWRAIGRTAAIGLLIVVPCVGAYAYLYTLGLAPVGHRSIDDVRNYSATIGSFLASPERNVLFGWSEGLLGGINEKQLFPGLVASALAVIALARIRQPYRVALAAAAAFAALMALGAHGPLYRFFYELVPGYANLRVPTRYGAFLSMAIAALAACGLADLLRTREGVRGRLALAASLALAVLVETASAPPYRRTVPESPTFVDRYLASQPDAVVMEYPFALSGWLPANDPLYQMRSIHHWRPLVNGYSGNYPPEYLRLLEHLDKAPAGGTEWLDAIRDAGATHLVVHKDLEKPDITGALLYELERRSDVQSLGEMACWPDRCGVYKLRPGKSD